MALFTEWVVPYEQRSIAFERMQNLLFSKKLPSAHESIAIILSPLWETADGAPNDELEREAEQKSVS